MKDHIACRVLDYNDVGRESTVRFKNNWNDHKVIEAYSMRLINIG